MLVLEIQPRNVSFANDLPQLVTCAAHRTPVRYTLDPWVASASQGYSQYRRGKCPTGGPTPRTLLLLCPLARSPPTLLARAPPTLLLLLCPSR